MCICANRWLFTFLILLVKPKQKCFSFLERALCVVISQLFSDLILSNPSGQREYNKETEVQRSTQLQTQNFKSDDPVPFHFMTLNSVTVMRGMWAGSKQIPEKGAYFWFPVSCICAFFLIAALCSSLPRPTSSAVLMCLLLCMMRHPFRSWQNSPVSSWYCPLASGPLL